MTWCRHISRARRTHTTIRRCYFHVCVCVRFLSERALPGVRRPVTISRNATRNCFHSALPFASLPPLFASLSLSRHLLYCIWKIARSWTIEPNFERSIVRSTKKGFENVSNDVDAKVKRSRFDRSSRFVDSLSQRVQTLSFRLFIAHRTQREDRRFPSDDFARFRANLERAEHGSMV